MNIYFVPLLGLTFLMLWFISMYYAIPKENRRNFKPYFKKFVKKGKTK